MRERALNITTEQLSNANRMRQALKWVFHAVKQNIRAVPRKGPGELPPHEIVMEEKADGGTAGDFIHALERNLGAIGLLMPTEYVVAVDVRDLKTLMNAAKLRLHSGAEIFTVEQLHERGLQTLDSWSYQRGREIDDQEQHVRFKAV